MSIFSFKNLKYKEKDALVELLEEWKKICKS